MNVLWFAFGIYIIGVSALLILQPKMMFENQVWKEFGLHNTTKATIFPVWMFIILWSFLSYGAASIVVTMLSNIASGAYEYKHTPLINKTAANETAANAPTNNTPSFQSQLSKQLSKLQEQVSSLLESPEPVTPEPASTTPIPRNSVPYHRRRLRRRHAKPGYYIRNDSREDGPKYIYYGEEPPQ